MPLLSLRKSSVSEKGHVEPDCSLSTPAKNPISSSAVTNPLEIISNPQPTLADPPIDLKNPPPNVTRPKSFSVSSNANALQKPYGFFMCGMKDCNRSGLGGGL